MTLADAVPIVQMVVCPMEAPNDVRAVEKALASGEFEPADVVAVIAKSEGQGLHNDYGRLFCETSLRSALARACGCDEEEIAGRVSIIVSGGTPGVISPHATLVAQRWVPRAEADHLALSDADGGGLVVGRAKTEEILPEDIGRRAQVDKVAAAVRSAMASAGLTDPKDVHLVMAKGPALTQKTIAEALERGNDVVTSDPGIGPMGSMCWSNDGAALGVAVALGEVPDERVTDDVIRRDWSLFSEVAATSAGGEKRVGEVLLLGNRPDSASDIRIGHALIRDLVDSDGVREALRSAGLEVGATATPEQSDRIVQVFAKVVIPGEPYLRGARITLQDDHESHHVAKAIGGALVVGVTGKPMTFVSGGEKNSHMGPPGANPVAAVVRR